MLPPATHGGGLEADLTSLCLIVSHRYGLVAHLSEVSGGSKKVWGVLSLPGAQSMCHHGADWQHNLVTGPSAQTPG